MAKLDSRFDLAAAMTLGEAQLALRAAFRDADIETADLDVRVLMAGLAGLAPHELATRGDLVLASDLRHALEAATAARLAGKPVHRILGQRAFFGLTLDLSEATLEPRPDTETLVESVLPFVHDCAQAKGACSIVDLGVGTGGIGLALLSECEDARCLGIDISAEAVATARANASKLGLSDRYRAVSGDWLAGVDELFDLIVSNPPYIPTGDLAGLSREVVEHDPLLALDGGADGLDAYRQIASQARAHLVEGGMVALEIGIGQRESIKAVFEDEGFVLSRVASDLGGVERVLLFT